MTTTDLDSRLAVEEADCSRHSRLAAVVEDCCIRTELPAAEEHCNRLLHLQSPEQGSLRHSLVEDTAAANMTVEEVHRILRGAVENRGSLGQGSKTSVVGLHTGKSCRRGSLGC